MNIQDVKERVRLQAGNDLGITNDHGITLRQALVPPERISVIIRTVRSGRVKDTKQTVWLVGKENSGDGYSIVMEEDGLQFGLASTGFPRDEHPILTGWYGGLVSAFLSM
jgi:hypothetical protein